MATSSTEVMAKKYYDKGLLAKDDLKKLVEAGKLSQAAYKRITFSLKGAGASLSIGVIE